MMKKILFLFTVFAVGFIPCQAATLDNIEANVPLLLDAVTIRDATSSYYDEYNIYVYVTNTSESQIEFYFGVDNEPNAGGGSVMTMGRDWRSFWTWIPPGHRSLYVGCLVFGNFYSYYTNFDVVIGPEGGDLDVWVDSQGAYRIRYWDNLYPANHFEWDKY